MVFLVVFVRTEGKGIRKRKWCGEYSSGSPNQYDGKSNVIV